MRIVSKKEGKKKEAKKSELDLANEKIAELTDSLQRLQAEFENYKKHVDKQSENFKKYAKEDLIVKILPIAWE